MFCFHHVQVKLCLAVCKSALINREDATMATISLDFLCHYATMNVFFILFFFKGANNDLLPEMCPCCMDRMDFKEMKHSELNLQFYSLRNTLNSETFVLTFSVYCDQVNVNHT